MNKLEEMVRDIVREEIKWLLANQPPPVNDARTWVAENEVAKRMGVCTRTLRNYRRTGDGPPFSKVGTRVLYQMSDVEEWMNRKKRGAK